MARLCAYGKRLKVSVSTFSASLIHQHDIAEWTWKERGGEGLGTKAPSLFCEHLPMPCPTPRQNVWACVIFGYFRFACGVRFRLILLSALRCLRLVAVNQQPQMKDKRTTNTKRYVGNNLLQLLVLEMGLLEIIFGPRSGRHYLLVQLLIYSRFFQFVDRTTTKLNL